MRLVDSGLGTKTPRQGKKQVRGGIVKIQGRRGPDRCFSGDKCPGLFVLGLFSGYDINLGVSLAV